MRRDLEKQLKCGETIFACREPGSFAWELEYHKTNGRIFDFLIFNDSIPEIIKFLQTLEKNTPKTFMGRVGRRS